MRFLSKNPQALPLGLWTVKSLKRAEALCRDPRCLRGLSFKVIPLLVGLARTKVTIWLLWQRFLLWQRLLMAQHSSDNELRVELREQTK